MEICGKKTEKKNIVLMKIEDRKEKTKEKDG